MRRWIPLLAMTLATASPLAAQGADQAAAPAPATSLPDAELIERGRRLTEWLLIAQADSILAYMREDLHEKVGGKQGIVEMSTRLMVDAGNEVKVLEEKMTRRNGKPQYWRAVQFDGQVPEPIVFRWVFDETGRVVGAGINPLSKAPAPDP